MRQTMDASKILELQLAAEITNLDDLLAEERQRSLLAFAIYEARTAAGLAQKELAERVGTRQSVISRIEMLTTRDTASRCCTGSHRRCRRMSRCGSFRARRRSRSRTRRSP